VTTRLNPTALQALFRSPNGPIAAELAAAAVKVERQAKRLSPVDTGRLRNSITWELRTDARGLYAAVGTNVEYAPYVEFGTSKMSAQPFLRPALTAAGGSR
jgi:HK97 gp10 family phage protein